MVSKYFTVLLIKKQRSGKGLNDDKIYNVESDSPIRLTNTRKWVCMWPPHRVINIFSNTAYMLV